MKVGDSVRFSKVAVKVYGFDSDVGLVVDTESYPGSWTEGMYPDDYRVLINGKVELIGGQIDAEGHVEVIDESS
jgi:hypothetical protein